MFHRQESGCVYEYLKLIVSTDDNITKNTKIAFLQKGVDYDHIKNDIIFLIDNDFIKDLLFSKGFNMYNLSTHEGVTNFLERILSLVTVPESLVGKNIYLNIDYYTENQKVFDYFFNTSNFECNGFNTCI